MRPSESQNQDFHGPGPSTSATLHSPASFHDLNILPELRHTAGRCPLEVLRRMRVAQGRGFSSTAGPLRSSGCRPSPAFGNAAKHAPIRPSARHLCNASPAAQSARSTGSTVSHAATGISPVGKTPCLPG